MESASEVVVEPSVLTPSSDTSSEPASDVRPYVPVDIARAITLSESELAAAINAEEGCLRLGLRFSIEHAIRAGYLLIEAKRRFRHGQWLPWLKHHVDVSVRCVQVYMRVAKKHAAASLSDGGNDSIRDVLRTFARPAKRVGAKVRPAEPLPFVLRKLHCPHCHRSSMVKVTRDGTRLLVSADRDEEEAPTA